MSRPASIRWRWRFRLPRLSVSTAPILAQCNIPPDPSLRSAVASFLLPAGGHPAGPFFSSSSSLGSSSSGTRGFGTRRFPLPSRLRASSSFLDNLDAHFDERSGCPRSDRGSSRQNGRALDSARLGDIAALFSPLLISFLIDSLVEIDQRGIFFFGPYCSHQSVAGLPVPAVGRSLRPCLFPCLSAEGRESSTLAAGAAFLRRGLQAVRQLFMRCAPAWSCSANDPRCRCRKRASWARSAAQAPAVRPEQRQASANSSQRIAVWMCLIRKA